MHSMQQGKTRSGWGDWLTCREKTFTSSGDMGTTLGSGFQPLNSILTERRSRPECVTSGSLRYSSTVGRLTPVSPFTVQFSFSSWDLVFVPTGGGDLFVWLRVARCSCRGETGLALICVLIGLTSTSIYRRCLRWSSVKIGGNICLSVLRQVRLRADLWGSRVGRWNETKLDEVQQLPPATTAREDNIGNLSQAFSFGIRPWYLLVPLFTFVLASEPDVGRFERWGERLEEYSEWVRWPAKPSCRVYSHGDNDE